MTARIVLLLTAAVLAATPVHADDLSTIAERSQYARTGRYDEVERLCASFARTWPKAVRCAEFGRTPEGRPMLALVASSDGMLTAAAARAKTRPVVVIQGGIHAGEIDGKDAGFLALREILEGKAAPGVLGKVTLVFVPVFNVDGHERVSRANRPNQVGPEEVGWRVTSQNLNLNRDYVKAEAPEMHAMLRLLGEWDPIVYADLHVTDGAEFEHDVSLNVSPTLVGDEPLRAAAIALRDALLQRLTAQGSLPLGFYPSFRRDDDPASGFAAEVLPPRFSTEYWAIRNRLGVLVETHSWKPYPTRVRVTRNCVVDLLELAGERGSAWLDAARAVDRAGAMLAGTSVPLRYVNTDRQRTIAFRGYAYRREPSAISGGLVTRYDATRPEVWQVPLFDEVRPAASTEAPRAGYVVPAGYVALVEAKLVLHGIESRRLAAPAQGLAVQTFRATKATPGTATFEGRTPLTLEGAWADERRDVPAGSLFVPIAQPKARLLMTLAEPGSPDALVAWGFFTAAFERKEYMEAYVTETVAAEMLAKDPALKAAFEKRLGEDPAFARDPRARLDFFYRRHPAWDERHKPLPDLPDEHAAALSAMPIYHWKGLTHGQSIEGDLDVDSKEIALRRLRERGVVVREIRDRDSGERTPIAPLPPVAGAPAGREPMAERLARARAQGPRPFRGLPIAAGLVAAAAAGGTLAPVVFVDCARGDDRPLTCTVSERVLGVYPLRETTLSPVIAVDTESRSSTVTRNGRQVSVSSERLVLKDGRGHEARSAWGDGGLGVDGPTMQGRIRDLIADPTAGQASMWQAAWVPLILPGALLALALLVIALSIAGMFSRPTDWIHAGVGALAEAADRKRRRGR